MSTSMNITINREKTCCMTHKQQVAGRSIDGTHHIVGGVAICGGDGNGGGTIMADRTAVCQETRRDGGVWHGCCAAAPSFVVATEIYGSRHIIIGVGGVEI